MSSDPSTGGDLVRLWTPWRMRYVGGGAEETGCIFCNRLAADADVETLILYRGERCFVILNLFPYNTGHLMLVPNAHVASPEQAEIAALEEIARLLPVVLVAVRRALRCDGFNLGINVGSVAGAGVADHLHQHLVPRWEGDANFMPILASTMVLPELLPITYAKIRTELLIGLGGPAEVPLVVFADRDRRVLAVERDGAARLPRIAGADDSPVWWRAVEAAAGWGGVPVELAGWAGSDAAVPDGTIALALRAETSRPDQVAHIGWWIDCDPLLPGQLDTADLAILQAALAMRDAEPRG